MPANLKSTPRPLLKQYQHGQLFTFAFLLRTLIMLTFKSPEDLAKLPPEDPAFPIVQELIEQLINVCMTRDVVKHSKSI